MKSNAYTTVPERFLKPYEIPRAKLDAAIEILREHNADATIVTTPWNDLTGAQLIEAMEGGATVEKALEELAAQNTAPLPQIKTSVKDGICHLSGLANQAAALWKQTADPALVAAYTLTTIGKSLRKMTDQPQTMRAEQGEKPLPVVYAGGVMSNKFIRPILTKGAGWRVYFSEPAFSADNAAGTAILCALRAQ